MDNQESPGRITALTEQLGELPKGYISRKTIHDKTYYYHQWSEGGKKRSRYLHNEEIEPLASQIEQRKALQAELRHLKREPPQKNRKRNEVHTLKCILMHKRAPVAEIELDDTTGLIQRINTVYSPEHLPVGVPVRNGIAERTALNEWWTDRSIPASRSGVREALETLEIASTKMLLVRCYGLSLSDQYWICPEGSNLTWDAINFFEHDFSDDIGDVLFGAVRKANVLDFSSPDNTSDGNLKKRWKIVQGKRCLVKGGSNPFRQQPFNEVIAARIMERLEIPHVPYTLTWNNGAPYSICEDFVTEDTELIPAWRIMKTRKKSKNDSAYQHFISCCEALGIQGSVHFLDRMIVLDYIIANEDRHLNNFGVLRHAETLEWLRFAPIYDSGSSLGYDKMPRQMRLEKEILCKPFKKTHAEQIQLVSDFSWIDFEQLADVDDLIESTLTAEGAEEYMDEIRIQAIIDATEHRIGKLAQLAAQSATR